MQMSFNITKCHSLHLGKRNNSYRPTYTMPKTSNFQSSENYVAYTITFHPLKKVQNEKDLGVTIDDQLNFKLYIIYITLMCQIKGGSK